MHGSIKASVAVAGGLMYLVGVESLAHGDPATMVGGATMFLTGSVALVLGLT